MEEGRQKAGLPAANEEDVLSYILFPPVAESFFAARETAKQNRVSYTIEKLED